jgi:hypothetical protein
VTTSSTLYAFVALDRRIIAYFAKAELPSHLVTLRIPGGTYGPGGEGERDFAGATFARALATMDEIAAARASPGGGVMAWQS